MVTGPANSGKFLGFYPAFLGLRLSLAGLAGFKSGFSQVSVRLIFAAVFR
jgi:hypothetical protein